MSPQLSHLDHLVLTVHDIPTTIAFYETALGMSTEAFTVADGSTRTALKYGTQKINLHQAGTEFTPCAGMPTPGSADLCFLSDGPLGEWQTHFTTLNIDIIEGPVKRTGAAGPIKSLYIRDPDRNLIEVSVLI